MVFLRICTIKASFTQQEGPVNGWVRRLGLSVAFLAALSLFLLGACANPEARLEKDMNQVRSLKSEGRVSEAIALLERLNERNPEDARILQALAMAYAMEGDFFTSGLFFESAARLGEGTLTGLHLLAADDFIQAGEMEGAIRNIQAYLESNPENAEAWFQKGALLAELNRHRAALNAYMSGLPHLEGAPSPATELAIGLLFQSVENRSQARRFLESASLREGPHQLQARIELLRLLARERLWNEVEALMEVVERAHPGTLEATDLARVRVQLREWRQAQEALAALQSELLAPVEEPEMEVPHDDTDSGTETAEAEPAGSVDGSVAVLSGSAETVSDDPESPAEREDASGELAGVPSHEAAGSGIAETAPVSERPVDESPDPLAELISQVDGLLQAGAYEEVLELLWGELSTVGTDARIWQRMSLAYFALGDFAEAEMTALEALRRNPNSLSLQLNFLRAAQQTMPPARFLSELEKAYDRFPNSPEVVLALARGYERIARAQRNADLLLLRFLELAPNHPRAATIRGELESRGAALPR